MALVSAGHADLTALTSWALLCCVLSSQKTVFSPQRHHYTQSPCWFILERYKWCGHRRLWNMSKQNSRNSSRGKSCEVLRCVPRKHDKTSQTMKKEQPYTTAACAAGVVTKTTDRDSLRYTYNGTRRVRQLALGCESNWVKSTHDAYENTRKCGKLKLYFSPSAGG